MERSSAEIGAGRLLAIGDIHGCRKELELLLAEMAPSGEDRLVFLGDYIDRGPDSAGVIDLLLELREALPRSVFLRGNHEQMLLDHLAGGDPAMFLVNGGFETLRSYRESKGWPPPASHREFFEETVCRYETEAFIFVHAGLRPGVVITDQQETDLLWIRRAFLDSEHDWGKCVVFGHTPLQEPFLTARRIGLDTGCVYGRALTGCAVESRRTWQVPRRR